MYTHSIVCIYYVHKLCNFISYLQCSGHQYGRPIAGQKEVSGTKYPNQDSLWQALVRLSSILLILCFITASSNVCIVMYYSVCFITASSNVCIVIYYNILLLFCIIGGGVLEAIWE